MPVWYARTQTIYDRVVNKIIYIFPALKSYDGDTLLLNNIQRSDMGAYMCIASNGIPPSVSKRFIVKVHCKYSFEHICTFCSSACSGCSTKNIPSFSLRPTTKSYVPPTTYWHQLLCFLLLKSISVFLWYRTFRTSSNMFGNLFARLQLR